MASSHLPMISTLPYPFFNLITMFTSAVLLYWFLRAFIRFSEMLRIRCAVLSRRIVSLRGLSNYLAMMVEISTQSHINAILHIRQSFPPKIMKVTTIPFAVDHVTVDNISRLYAFNLWLGQRDVDHDNGGTQVFVLFDFHVDRFHELCKHLHVIENPSNINAPSIRLQHLLNTLVNRTSGVSSEEVCLFDSIFLRAHHSSFIDCSKIHRVSIMSRQSIYGYISSRFTQYYLSFFALSWSCVSSFPNDATSAISLMHRTKPIAIIILSSNNDNMNGSTSAQSRESKSTWLRPLVSPGDIETGHLSSNPLNLGHSDDNTTVSRSREKLLPHPARGIAAPEVAALAFSVFNVNTSAPAPSPATNGSRATSPGHARVGVTMTMSDCFLYSRQGAVYSAQELFGWSAVDATKKSSETVEEGTDSRGFDEECVICLAEKKDVALLPCRHVCVCHQCLVRIDKCPVCRSGFEEYVALSMTETSTIQMPLIRRIK